MTKDWAIKALKQGKRITCRYFTPEEWVEMHKCGGLVFETGCRVSMTDFWENRSHGSWSDSWSEFKEEPTCAN